jgi:hypothetical protein
MSDTRSQTTLREVSKNFDHFWIEWNGEFVLAQKDKNSERLGTTKLIEFMGQETYCYEMKEFMDCPAIGIKKP